jgi:hypothetical protein
MHVLRDGLSAFSTNEQQHYFNCPFQVLARAVVVRGKFSRSGIFLVGGAGMIG